MNTIKNSNSPARASALKAIDEVRLEIFEDGAEADLHSLGITTLAEAYAQGFHDGLDAARRAVTQSPMN